MSEQLLTHQILREVRHPAWVPTNPDGTTPGGTAPVPNGWMPIGFGRGDRDVGGTMFTADKGHMVTLTGYNETDTIEDQSGDGDDAQQMRSVDFEVPGNRTLNAIVARGYRYIAAFLTTVRRDAARRPFELRETFFESTAAGTIMTMGAVTDAATFDIDGAGAADLAVDDLITIAGVTGQVRRIIARTATSLTLDAAVTAADNAVITRVVRTSQTIQQFLVQGRSHEINAKTTTKVSAELVPYDAATESGLS